MKKFIKYTILVILFFTINYLIVNLFFSFELVKDLLSNLSQIWKIDFTNKSTIIISLFVSFFESSYAKKYFESWLKKKEDERMNSPYIKIRIENCSIVKKNHTNNSLIKVYLRSKHKPEFIYIFSSFKNVGNGVISSLEINKTLLFNGTLNKDEEKSFCFCFYLSSKSIWNRLSLVKIKIIDEKDNKYKGISVIKLNKDFNKAKIKTIIKQRII